MAKYPFHLIEKKWQDFWDKQDIFSTPASPDLNKPKLYILDMFPYPSGAGLHVGHPEGYTATDILARYKRMKGFQVLHPMGWDAFGLPAEQYALDTGTHPEVTTKKNIDQFRRQLKSLGLSYDWKREISTTDKTYYKWTQWIVSKLFEKGLAYQASVPVNWCPALGTVLANEEVIEGKSERGAHPVVRKPMKQWMLKITAYADRLLEDLDDLDWPESTKEMQRNWIGRSVGAEVDFKLQDFPHENITVFTTRPDTLFGATYIVLAPEHDLVQKIVTHDQKQKVLSYVEKASRKSDLERTELQKEKTGVFTGAYAINPVNQKSLPIWVADYVLGTYGTGAIMAVPAHDTRDYEFATAFNLPIISVISGGDIHKEAYTGDGIVVNSEGVFSINGQNAEDAKKSVIAWLETNGVGSQKVNYKLRDWLFSRQRYWGEPFPIVFEDNIPRVVPDKELPVMLPEVESYRPSGTGESPLSTIPDWVNIKDDNGKIIFKRETNTMPQWAGSCWYYLRFIDPHNEERLVDPLLEKFWMPVDVYVGGAEHSVLHLLYARFWHKFLYDLGVVSTKEPFQRLIHQGLILGEMEYRGFQTEKGAWVSLCEVNTNDMTRKGTPEILKVVSLTEDQIEKKNSGFVLRTDNAIEIEGRSFKMSKSRGNVVNPDQIVEEYGADSLRLYEMFMGPLEQVKPWSMKGVEGVHRFLNRLWRLMMDEESERLNPKIGNHQPNREQSLVYHKTVKKVTEDIENMRFNTAIASMMEFMNEATKWETLPVSIAKGFILILSPFAPHICEELWQNLGYDDILAYHPWPLHDESVLHSALIEVAVQVNGKLRGKLCAQKDISEEEVIAMAKQDEKISVHLNQKSIIKQIYVPGKILNFVVKP